MDFELSEQHLQVQETARRIAREVVAPRAAEVDSSGRYPDDFFEAFRDAGLLGLSFPSDLGGSDAGTLGLAIAVEEMAKYCSSAGLILLTTRLGTGAITIAGTPEQKEWYVRGVAEGKLRGAFALTELGTGSDAAGVATTAIPTADGWALNGNKLWAGQSTVADYALVVAKTDPEAGARGVSLFIVDLPNPGFRIVRELPKMGVRGVPVVEIALDNATVPASALVGEENQGFRLVMRHLNSVRPLVAARGVGLAAGATEYAAAYARKRMAFGKRLADFEGISFKLAELALEIEASRLLTYRAAWLVDQGRTDRDVAHFLSMAKAMASETAVRASEQALHTLGGYGYLEDYPTDRYYRDAVQLPIVEGTSEIQRLIIARALDEGLLEWGYDVTAAGGLPEEAILASEEINAAR